MYLHYVFFVLVILFSIASIRKNIRFTDTDFAVLCLFIYLIVYCVGILTLCLAIKWFSKETPEMDEQNYELCHAFKEKSDRIASSDDNMTNSDAEDEESMCSEYEIIDSSQ